MKLPASFQKLTEKRILLLGLGTEGWSTYRFLRQHFPGLMLTIADQKPLEQFPDDQQQTLRDDSHLQLELGETYRKHLVGFNLIFKAPGIPRTLPEIEKATEKGAILASHTQLFFELCPGKIIGITGTKGKSTTSAVIHHVLKKHGLKTVLVGNIGRPALDFLEEVTADTLVVFELSSHQLETLSVSPHIAVIQNITSEHLDYYRSTAEYRAAKSAIARFQRQNDCVVYNPQFETAAEIARLSKGKHFRHSIEEGPDAVVFVRSETIVFRDPKGVIHEVLPVSKLPLAGKHNIYNVLPAVIIGTLCNISPEEIGQSLADFQPLPHRLQLVAEKNGVRYYDDSLATMPDAAISALENFEEPIVLIAGGYERHQDFSELAKTILQKKIAGLVLFQPTGQRLAEAVKALVPEDDVPPIIEFAESMPEAVKTARKLIPSWGGVILLSPASASFGMFQNYQDRGKQFVNAAREVEEL